MKTIYTWFDSLNGQYLKCTFAFSFVLYPEISGFHPYISHTFLVLQTQIDKLH
jgi:hypothetical protein